MNEIKIEKKRGRKPKQNKDINEKKITDNENVFFKKRGRKPKQKTEEELKLKIPRKRGRKPKEKSYSVIKPILSYNDHIDENIILHLSITQNDIKNITKDSLIELYENNDIPIPYEPDNNFEKITSFENKSLKNLQEKNIILTDINDNISELIQTDDNINKKLIKRNLQNIMFEFLDANHRNEWPKYTKIHCWWDFHKFDSMPVALPERFIKDKFHLFGCFCSFNCAAAYNFESKTYNMWERYSLLNLLYKKLYNTNDIKIKPSPPRETLKILGGFLNIEEFRKNFLSNIEYHVVIPPMISVLPRIEENYFEIPNKQIDNFENTTVHDMTLKLKRDKPITNPKNTLESYIGLKVI